MAVDENLPFPRGTTYFGAGGTPNATDGLSLEGREYEVDDVSPAGVRRSYQRVRLRVVRNECEVAIHAKQLVTFSTSANEWGTRILGYSRLAAAGTALGTKAFPVDEYLPSSGCPTNDLCYIVVRGPSLCQTNFASDASGTIAVGAPLQSASAHTSGQTQSASTDIGGKVCAVTISQTVSSLDLFNSVGIALSARASTQTATDILVNIGRI